MFLEVLSSEKLINFILHLLLLFRLFSPTSRDISRSKNLNLITLDGDEAALHLEEERLIVFFGDGF